MKEFSVRIFQGTLIALCSLAGPASLVAEDQLQQARVSQIVQDVRLLQSHGAPQPAVVNDKVTHGMGVRTGVESRAELTFNDLTITRLGANTIFSFKEGAREVDLTSGAVLLQVPPKSPAVKVSTAAVTAAVTGGTALFSTGPPTKFMVLEGVGTFYPAGHPERTATIQGGEMMTMTADGRMAKPEKFDVKTVLKTSRLIKDFPPLENMPLIMAVVDLQLAQLQLASLGNQALAASLINTIGTTDQNVNSNPVVLVRNANPTPPPIPPTPPPITPTPPPITPTPPPPTPTVSPSGTPTKFGTPSTISSPNPYVITSDTVISTDPSITTNGVTDYGKIYRGQSVDGPFSAWAFGSTSGFDTASGFDALIGDNSGAAFKFAALQLTGDPTIDITNGEINLGLIAVNGITSGGPGGGLTFSGIQNLLLATQNGPITLGPEISFSGLHSLIIYARGASSDLTLGSDISTTSEVNLFAERDMSLTSSITTESLNILAGRNLNWNGQTSVEMVSNSDGNVNILAGQAIDVANDLVIVRLNGGVTSGLNVFLNSGTDLTVGGDLSIATDIGNLTDGANINVLAGGDLTVGGSLTLQTSATTQSGTGANISLDVGGNLTAADLFFGVELGINAAQASGENVTLFVGQNLVTHNDSNTGGVDLEIITPVQQTVNAGANLFLNVGGNLTTDTGGNTKLFINNNNNEVVTGANIIAAIGGNLTTNNLTLQLLNNGGEIGTGGIVSLAASGDITAHGDAIFDIQNNGGTMDQNTAIAVAAGNINANSLSAQIDNTGGTIAGAGVIEMDVAGNANITNDATIAFYGSDAAAAAGILINGGNYNVGGTFLTYMDGNGAITFNNASAHADILKAGVFGANGVLNIGGGNLSADTVLELYAPGSNGQLNFVSNVTLGGNSTKILAANSITIFDNVVVTIGGKLPAAVYTNNANYSEQWGGNGSTTGTFAGVGAKRPQPLSEAPPFGGVSPGNPSRGKRVTKVININNTDQLLALIDGGVLDRSGKARFPHNRHRQGANADRVNFNRMMKADRDMADIRRMRDHGVVNNRIGSNARSF